MTLVDGGCGAGLAGLDVVPPSVRYRRTASVRPLNGLDVFEQPTSCVTKCGVIFQRPITPTLQTDNGFRLVYFFLESARLRAKIKQQSPAACVCGKGEHKSNWVIEIVQDAEW
jgi:hypothetical protein